MPYRLHPFAIGLVWMLDRQESELVEIDNFPALRIEPLDRLP